MLFDLKVLLLDDLAEHQAALNALHSFWFQFLTQFFNRLCLNLEIIFERETLSLQSLGHVPHQAFHFFIENDWRKLNLCLLEELFDHSFGVFRLCVGFLLLLKVFADLYPQVQQALEIA